MRYINESSNTFLFKNKDLSFIRLDELNLNVVFKDGSSINLEAPFSDFLDDLNPYVFYKTDSGYIININEIVHYKHKNSMLFLKSGHMIPSSHPLFFLH